MIEHRLNLTVLEKIKETHGVKTALNELFHMIGKETCLRLDTPNYDQDLVTLSAPTLTVYSYHGKPPYIGHSETRVSATTFKVDDSFEELWTKLQDPKLFLLADDRKTCSEAILVADSDNPQRNGTSIVFTRPVQQPTTNGLGSK